MGSARRAGNRTGGTDQGAVAEPARDAGRRGHPEHGAHCQCAPNLPGRGIRLRGPRRPPRLAAVRAPHHLRPDTHGAPGRPARGAPTPRGIFHVEWKAGPNYISNEFDEPMPWAVFFAPGGIAFHGGSLITPSHGCVHLTIGSALYYHNHLSIGAEVAVS